MLNTSNKILNKNGLLVLGNPIMDVIVTVDNDWIKQNHLQKGVVNFLSGKKLQTICNHSILQHKSKYYPGGSAANTALNISRLGYEVSFVGHVGNDPLTKIFIKKMQSSGISDKYLHTNHDMSISRCYIFVTSDGERTIVPFLGASERISISDINVNLIKQHVGIFTDSYLLGNAYGVNLINNALVFANKHDVLTCFTLADLSCVKKYHQIILKLLPNINILVGNIREFEFLFQESDTEVLIQKLQTICQQTYNKSQSMSMNSQDLYQEACFNHAPRQQILESVHKEHIQQRIFILTLDKYGSFFISKNRSIFVQIKPYLPNAKIVDTTGAGDSFVAGFLFNYLNDKSIEACLRLATWMGSSVVQQFGGLINYRLLRTIKRVAGLNT